MTKEGEQDPGQGNPHDRFLRNTLSAIRSPDYDYLIAVRFEHDFTLRDAWRLSRTAVEDVARWSEHGMATSSHSTRRR